MPYGNGVGRAQSQALVPEKVVNSMLGKVDTATSAARQLFKKIPVVSAETRIPILSALPKAYWVKGDTGLKQTTGQAWENKFLNVEELAVIVPIPENVLDDVQDAGGIDLWDELEDPISEAIGRQLDQAIFFGIEAPETFPMNIAAQAEARGFEHLESATASAGGIQDDIDQCLGQTEIVGFDPSGIVGARTLKGKLRRARSTIGERLSGVNPEITEYMGLPIAYPMRGLFPTGANRVEAFVGDFGEYALGIRKEITMKVLDQAVISNTAGEVELNLPQEDMIAVRFTFRAGWQVSNRIRYDEPAEEGRYPVSVLKSAT